MDEFNNIEFDLGIQNKLHNSKGYILLYADDKSELHIAVNTTNLNECEANGLVRYAENCGEYVLTPSDEEL